MVLKTCIALLVTSCISQLQWSWYLETRPLRDLVAFHDAATGAIGCVSWLWNYHLRQPLAALGAIITIIAIAIDPFIQQLVQSIDCSQILSGYTPASVPRTNFMGYKDWTESLEESILDGLYAMQNLTDFNCPTGNCTFSETYSSLSFCSQCVDRSAEATIDEQCFISQWDGGRNATREAVPCNVDSPSAVTQTWNLTTSLPPSELNFYFEDGPFQNISGNPLSEPHVFSLQQLDILSALYQGQAFGAVLGYSDSAIFRTDPTWTVSPLSGCDNPTSNDTWRCRGYGIAECTLHPCVRTFSCSIEGGRVNEITVDHSSRDQVWGAQDPVLPSLYGLLDMQCITDDDRGNLAEAGYDLVEEASGRWLPYNITFDPTTTPVNASSPFPQSLLGRGCLYLIDESFLIPLWDEYISPLLVGTVTREIIAEVTATNNSLPYSYQYDFNGTQQLLNLYDAGNVSMDSISATFDNLAQALTLWVRENGAANYSRRAEGDVLHYAVCVRVKWAWVALPAALAGLTLVLFILTVLTTAGRAVPLWKMFPLAVLFSGPAGRDWVSENRLMRRGTADTNTGEATRLPDDTDHDYDETVQGMLRISDRISVKLLQKQDGRYQLRQVEPPSK
ncbi:hypothetical protein M406DRAFT_292805 [Cryphonectria parasitica EP155]|uniref:Uncharacterized protein n=1 Tax=Cryphonectria parasitica (strain ATCC 38755 / EP155) TaxID=660469 RepID=A0A9P4XYD8_CRYP1|nr:uncharacterized protein M406DRAFT_292805 [Cryphonectria parasitica EP155]KAF3763178.1 hypothetical protein M406DRAFT_292805 [Cryphonectria parasitica EP155]